MNMRGDEKPWNFDHWADRYDGWLQEEHFVQIEELRPVFADLGMELNSRRFTPVTWVLWAIKPKEDEGRQTTDR
jgi:hypothetical protein